MQLNRSYIADINEYGVLDVILYDGLASPVHHFITYNFSEEGRHGDAVEGIIWVDITDLTEVRAICPVTDPVLFHRLNEMLEEYTR